MKLLIDGDQYLYKCAVACERDLRWDTENHVLYSNEEEVWDTLQASLRSVIDHFGDPDVTICLGKEPYFRHVIFPAYKPGRARKPLCFWDVRERLKAEYTTIERPGLEADDLMGILASKPGSDAVIVARDKDMKGVPAQLWDGAKYFNISEEEADRFHMYQTLIGDTTDGYKGCPGVGPVAAEEFLDDPHILVPVDHEVTRGKNKGTKTIKWVQEELGERTLWDGIVSYYARAGLTEEDALLQARLARILRWSDWDSKKKEPILWTP